MDEIMNKIIEEVQQNLVIPGCTDKDLKDIASIVLTIAFSILNQSAVNYANNKKH